MINILVHDNEIISEGYLQTFDDKYRTHKDNFSSMYFRIIRYQYLSFSIIYVNCKFSTEISFDNFSLIIINIRKKAI